PLIRRVRWARATAVVEYTPRLARRPRESARPQKTAAHPSAVRRCSLLVCDREPQVGIEPTTARLRIECSTPELLWRGLALHHALARTRTATPCGTTPSRWRVYQFHHQGNSFLTPHTFVPRPTSHVQQLRERRGSNPRPLE